MTKPIPLIINQRDYELLTTLGSKVRLLSAEQVRDAFFSGDNSNMRRRLQQLCRHQLLSSLRPVLRIIPRISSPLCFWEPSEPAPNFQRISHSLMKRWTSASPIATKVILHGPRTKRCLGTKANGCLPHILQASHDLALSDVYLWYRENRTVEAQGWQSEDTAGRLWGMGKRPDAVISLNPGVINKAIELGGLYSPARLLGIHRACEQRNVPYEVW